MHLFGGNNTFAISYRPVPSLNSARQTSIYCHLVLNGISIGNPDEVELVGTYVLHLNKLKEQVKQHQGRLKNPLFEGLTDREIIEQIYKSNQLEQEFNLEYSHLQVLSTNELWHIHNVTLATSTDAYALVVIEENQCLKFLWQLWQELEKGSKQVNTALVPYEAFYSAIDECLEYLKHAYSQKLE